MRRERGAAAAADRQRHRLRDLHDDDEGRSTPGTPAPSACSATRPTRSSAAVVNCSRPRIAPPASGRELERRAPRRPRARRALAPSRRRPVFFGSGVTTRLGRRRPRLRQNSARPDCRSEAEVALSEAHATLEERVDRRTSELAQRQEQVAGCCAAGHRQEEQRGRIARDLHDQLGQQLTALRLTLERAQSGGGRRRDELERARSPAVTRRGRLPRVGAASGRARRSRAGRGAAALPSRMVAASSARAEFRVAGLARGQLTRKPRSPSIASPRRR